MKPHAPLFVSAAALGLVAALSLTGQESGPAAAPAGQAPARVTLFSNVRIFDGKSATLSAPSNVLVRGNKIEKISTDPIRSMSPNTPPPSSPPRSAPPTTGAPMSPSTPTPRGPSASRSRPA